METQEILTRNLEYEGYRVHSVSSVEEAIIILKNNSLDLIITDFKMPKVTGLDLIKFVKDHYHNLEIIMITGYPSIDSAKNAIKYGAYEYLLKPFTDHELLETIQKVVQKIKNRKNKQNNINDNNFMQFGIIGKSKPMLKIFSIIEKLKNNFDTVLITGESGTGKELIARALHYNGYRSNGPFVPVNCAAIPDSLFESELFGHVKGSFTGADYSKLGFFQSANNGTIFLDEISEMSPLLQTKLLRVLQNKEIYMVGSAKPQKIDIQIIASSNQDLNELIQQNKFRNDLYYRLNVINITLPPLRERTDDIIILTNFFLNKYCNEYNKSDLVLEEDIIEIFQNYQWPGNIREMENLIKRIVILAEGKTIKGVNLPDHMKYNLDFSNNYKQSLLDIEKKHIKKVLNHCHNNKTAAAKILGINRKTLREKLIKFKIV
ncbi:MAG: sigma-54 dependent transcriptional regulator [Spirochaetes bacterium]|nr:sigma-54 dependent transcriptional regulator [Spirochaetota bacterium]